MKPIVVPALVTLAVTLVRLLGELGHGPRLFFNPEAGGFGALVGITWLAPVFGIYFALKLKETGESRPSGWACAGFALLGVALFVGLNLAGSLLEPAFFGQLTIMGLAALPAVAVFYRAWPQLGRLLLAYGLAARLPVLLIMLAAMLGNWGTHYDVASPDTPSMGPWMKWFWIGVVPQLTLWMAYTVLIGGLFGGVALAVGSGRKNGSQPA
jgi:hypothetical protein